MNAPVQTQAWRARHKSSTQAQAGSLVLTPTQMAAYDRLETLWRACDIVILTGRPGLGKSRIAARFAATHGARLVTAADLVQVMEPLDDLWFDLPLMDWLRSQLIGTHTLVLDGVVEFLHQLRGGRIYIARYLILEALYRDAERLGVKLVITGPAPDREQSQAVIYRRSDLPTLDIALFNHHDYAAFAAYALGEAKAAAIDHAQMFRFAPLLNGYELRAVFGMAARLEELSTQNVLDILLEAIVSANTLTHEVEDVRFATMPGSEHIAKALETHVVTPLTDLALAERFDLRAKRGVLLYGPPGTGKTSVGRALAHRLKGRFFLIDGSVKTEPAFDFLNKVQAIVREAIDNAPCVLFIDDADVLFDVGHVAGLTRYLLTLLDGLAGTSAARVCVMMTAMDAGKIPEAILRSGRVELWLETKLPNAPTRADIMARWMGDAIPAFANTDYTEAGAHTQGFTPADLRRVVADAKALYAMDLVQRQPVASGAVYVERAVRDILASRAAMAANLADPTLRVG
jgi:transitional endoplasmic reticulum ATPase